MGRGDKKSKKGKIWKGSYGKSRSRNAIRTRLKRLHSTKREAVTLGGETKAKTVRKPSRKKEA